MRTAIVTGVTSGFGEAIALRLLRDGWRVCGTGRRRDRLGALAGAWGEAFHPWCVDMRDRNAILAGVDALPTSFSAVDLLVNNAGLALGTDPADQANLDDWVQMIETNIIGLVAITRALLPRMVARGTGQIVNIGSVAGDYAYPGGNAYGGTKAFVDQFTMNLRADLVAKNIRVTNVAPGLCESEFSVVRFKGDASRAAAVYAGTDPIRPEDIADTVAWVVARPAHVNVNRIELMATCQAPGPFQIVRTPGR